MIAELYKGVNDKLKEDFPEWKVVPVTSIWDNSKATDGVRVSAYFETWSIDPDEDIMDGNTIVTIPVIFLIEILTASEEDPYSKIIDLTEGLLKWTRDQVFEGGFSPGYASGSEIGPPQSGGGGVPDMTRIVSQTTIELLSVAGEFTPLVPTDLVNEAILEYDVDTQ